MSLTIATWNVNSVKARLAHLLDWLKRAQPDIVLLQEIKCIEEAFPAMEIEELGYNLAIHGEKTYNGVAILSKFKLDDITRGLPGNEDDPHARYIEAVVSLSSPRLRGEKDSAKLSQEGGGHPHESPYPLHDTPTRRYAPTSPACGGGIIRIASVYVPNGQTTDSDKFQYKLRFLDRFHAHMQTLLSYDEMLVVGGDYNIAPQDSDVHDPKAWEGSVLTHDKVRARFRKILYLGMYDAQVVTSNQQLVTGNYTWWDYRSNAFAQDNGLRIDHLLLSPQAADTLSGCEVHRDVRALEKASDHAPVSATFNL